MSLRDRGWTIAPSTGNQEKVVRPIGPITRCPNIFRQTTCETRALAPASARSRAANIAVTAMSTSRLISVNALLLGVVHRISCFVFALEFTR